ncbi:MAG: MFS transporter [Firmicutes bacterium]|nr:MFS transporter [Bacillota bacterium]
MSQRWRRQSLLAGAGIFLSAYDMGIMAIALVSIKRDWALAAWQLSLVASVTSIGMIVGSVTGGVLADRYGRRALLMGDYVTFIGAAALSAMSPSIWWLLGARLLVGIGVGADYAISFTYLAEVIPRPVRGRVMAWAMWFANFGMVIAYFVGSVLLSTSSTMAWRWMLATGVVLAIPLVLARTWVKESPLWLRERHRLDHAGGFSGMRRPGVWRTLSVSQLSYFFYQITDQGLGMFLPMVLVALWGHSLATAAWSSVAVKAVTIPSALLTVWLIDRWGRRPLQIFGFLGRALSLAILALLFWRTPHVPVVVLAALMGLVYVFGPAGPDKTVVIAPAEQFSTRVRGTGEGLSEMAGRIGGVVGIVGYGMLAAVGGVALGLGFFAAACVLGTVVSLAMPETRPSSQTLSYEAEASS